MLRWLAPLSVAVLIALSTSALGSHAFSAPPIPRPSYGSYSWPVTGPVISPFEQPTGPYGPGHRGIDIGAISRTPVRAAADGVVVFAGRIAGELHVSVDHPDGVRTSYSFLASAAVHRGDPIARGDVLGFSGPGHAGVEPHHLHLGARIAGVYVDPMLLLERGSLVGLIHLAPIEEGDLPPVP